MILLFCLLHALYVLVSLPTSIYGSRIAANDGADDYFGSG
ncbi:hypothetical protein SAMN02745166_01007 [Prosthecobacter debontii]|uniref:Uncharacterized protein n=1 Tax=Prosthecobacter debontii TaxID=48467 RepID=A0A1T4X4J3_9BACT|nr:hypothetical protein SAMN02745166_01007 [Prosthecobacter debontii]